MAAFTRAEAMCEDQYLNCDGSCENHKVETADQKTYVSIDIGGLDKRVGGFFDLGRGGLYKGYFPEEISMALDYYPTNTQQTSYGFRWTPELKDWVLYRIAFWEELNRDEQFMRRDVQMPTELIIPRSFDVKRFPCCIKFSDFSHEDFALNPMTDELQKAEIYRDFERIRKYISDEGKYKIFTQNDHSALLSKNLPEEFIFELTLIIDSTNVIDLNNLAYYLLEGGHITSAITLLREIHRIFPNRVVATLNLADAYNELGMESEACSLYVEYIEKMHTIGRSSRIPKRLNDSEPCRTK